MQSMVINTMIQILLFSAAITEAPQPNVRSMRLTPAELNAMLSGGGIPGMAAAVPEETTDYDEEQEDTENE